MLAHWHRVAESVLSNALDMPLPHCTQRAERPKGSAPSTKPCSVKDGPSHDESITVCRCKRLLRAIAEQIRNGHQGALLALNSFTGGPRFRKVSSPTTSSAFLPISCMPLTLVMLPLKPFSKKKPQCLLDHSPELDLDGSPACKVFYSWRPKRQL